MNNTETRTYVYTSDEKDKAEKRKLRSVIMIAAGVLLLVVGMLLIVLAPALSDSKNIMPDVIGFDRDKAIAQLEKRGLEVDVIEAESDEYEAGVVIDQSIKPGEEVEPGMVVKLTVNVLKEKDSDVSESAPPIESRAPDGTDTDNLEHGGSGTSGGIFGGYSGDYGGGYSGDYSGDYGGDTSDDSGDSGSSGGSPASTPSPGGDSGTGGTEPSGGDMGGGDGGSGGGNAD